MTMPSSFRAQEETAATGAGAVAIGGGGGGGGVVLCAAAGLFSGLLSGFSFDGDAAGVGVWPSVVPGTACGVESVFAGEGCGAGGAAGLLGEATSGAGLDLGVS